MVKAHVVRGQYSTVEVIVSARSVLPESGRDAVGTSPARGQQADLFAYSSASNKSNRLMEVVDQINRKYARSTIHLTSEGVDRTWLMRPSFKSPNYMGDWKRVVMVS